jgi:hypothetical protein
MTLHYLNGIKDMGKGDRRAWVDYIRQWQDPDSGIFIGPEIVPGELTSSIHDWTHVTMHLTAHAVPALHILGGRPAYALRFAKRFLDLNRLSQWLQRRDWRKAWLEGNNLLFVGQFLIYLRDFEQCDEAQVALNLLFEWLNREQDPATGLWGTDGYCDAFDAIYGGYHQLLLYYYCNRPVPHAERIIDTGLGLQHSDGGFARDWGGGACEDVDVVDILVNLYKRTGHRPRAVRRALQLALDNILNQQLADGGFVYRKGQTFSQMGIQRTQVPANTSELFSTWFRVHTIALASQVIADHELSEIPWKFNNTCSMGWNAPQPLPEPKVDPWYDLLPLRWRRLGDRISKRAMRFLG